MGQLVALVVEDSAVHQRLLAEAFKASGHAVRLLVHPDADSAWTVIDSMRVQTPAEWPDFAVVDIGLPGISGIELVDRIRQLRFFDDWPIVMLTASADPDDRTEALLARATGYFIKPATAAGYVRLVREILAFLGAGPTPAAKRKVPARPKPSGPGPESR